MHAGRRLRHVTACARAPQRRRIRPASPYRATTVTWSKIIGFGATARADCRRARRLSYANYRRTPGAPCSTIYRNGCRASSRGCAARRGSPTTTSRTRCARCGSRCSKPTSRCRSSRTSSRRSRRRRVGEEVIGSLTPGQALIGVVHRELAALMGGAAVPLDFATQPPAVILLAGLQGAGKTTTAAKLAHAAARAEEEGAAGLGRRLPSGGDRAARACSARRSASTSFRPTSGEQPVAIAHGALDWAKRALSRRADRRHRGPPRDRRGDDARDRARCTRR